MKRVQAKPFRRHQYRTSMAETKRMWDDAFENVFLAKRPWLRNRAPDLVFAAENRVTPPTAKEVAAQYLSYSHPPYGLLKRLCENAKLPYARVASAIHYEKKKRAAAARTAA